MTKKPMKWALFLAAVLLLLLAATLSRLEIPDSATPVLAGGSKQMSGDCAESRLDLDEKSDKKTSHSDTYIDDAGTIPVLVWNIHKQGDGEWPQALWSWGEGWRLMMLQEVGLTDAFSSALGRGGYDYAALQSFAFAGQGYGLMTLSPALVSTACGYLSREPWIVVPKGSLVARYRLSSGDNLLAINLHGVNFAWSLEDWQAQLEPLFKAVAAHQGPVIFGGDFNAWGEDRREMLKNLVDSHGLASAAFSPDHRRSAFGNRLDWLFYRGLNLKSAQSPATELSDHAPLLAWFELMPGSVPDDGTPDARQ
ncbi:endonuclease/exonuclease/phosphatase family protein [Shewanella sp. JM162201]|uniref:Endonuclease/exonuclease/phosphatase family protein n=1 Tax=Shewanella jiangmenensis TaxID=2837387 RepID=A0ABS5V921_9GAMM|nr:endonuclease/exonuclease/phosphatase family protein [Shewanella jiangmenensis]MBT1446224.1 endonuclease/exonuclease/phosphatase family protein [Shewanella jiangmenensis]